MAALLIQREELSGLALSPEELEAEILAEAAAIDDAPPEEGSAAAIRVDAERHLAELHEQRRRLAPEAVQDPKVRQEYLDVESEITLTESTIGLVDTAEEQEIERERASAEAARLAALEDAEAQAQRLQPQIATAAARLDTAASTFAECVAAYRDLKQLQAGAIAGTDRGPEAVRARSYRPAEVAAALFVALRERGVQVEGIEGSNRALPLAATEPEKL
jgi:hypothetical protein